MQEQIVRPIGLQSEYAGVDFMAYMTKSGKCESRIICHSVNTTTRKFATRGIPTLGRKIPPPHGPLPLSAVPLPPKIF